MRFVDVYLPNRIPGYPCISVPRWSTDLAEAASGDETANSNWANARHTFKLPRAIRDHDQFEDLKDHWMAMNGPARLFAFRDPLDFASARLPCPNVEPTISRTDQQIGVGDGVTTSFQLVKTYTRGGASSQRTIQLPITSTVLVGLDGIDPPSFPFPGPYTFTVTREGGVVTFSGAIPVGVVVTAGYLFDVPVRFESDTTFEGVVRTRDIGEFADLTLVERRLC